MQTLQCGLRFLKSLKNVGLSDEVAITPGDVGFCLIYSTGRLERAIPTGCYLK